MRWAVISVVLISLTGHAQELPRFMVENPKKLAWNEAEALRIYDAATAVVKRELKLRKEPRPVFTLHLGAKENAVETLNGQHTLHLEKWDEKMFAGGVVMIVGRSLLSDVEIKDFATQALNSVQATVSVVELKKKKED